MAKIQLKDEKWQKVQEKFEKNKTKLSELKEKLKADTIIDDYGKFLNDIKAKVNEISQAEESIDYILKTGKKYADEIDKTNYLEETVFNEKITNKYDLVWADIKKMKLNVDFYSLENYKDFEWNQNGYFQLRMVSDGYKTVGFEDYSWSEGDFACINFYKDGHIDYMLDCDEQYTYNPTNFLDKNEIENKADKSIQLKVLEKLNWLIDNKIVACDKVKEIKPNKFRFQRSHWDNLLCWDYYQGDYLAINKEAINWEKMSIDTKKLNPEILHGKKEDLNKMIEKFLKVLKEKMGWKVPKIKTEKKKSIKKRS